MRPVWGERAWRPALGKHHPVRLDDEKGHTLRGLDPPHQTGSEAGRPPTPKALGGRAVSTPGSCLHSGDNSTQGGWKDKRHAFRPGCKDLVVALVPHTERAALPGHGCSVAVSANVTSPPEPCQPPRLSCVLSPTCSVVTMVSGWSCTVSGPANPGRKVSAFLGPVYALSVWPPVCGLPRGRWADSSWGGSTLTSQALPSALVGMHANQPTSQSQGPDPGPG